METTLQRLAKFADSQEISRRKFELSIGMSVGHMEKNLKKNSSLGTNYIESVLNIYPNLNPAWLLTGKGQMLLNPEKQPSENTEIDGGKHLITKQKALTGSENYKPLIEKIAALEKIEADLRFTIKLQEELLDKYRNTPMAQSEAG